MQLIAERADIPRKVGHHAADLTRSETMHQDLQNRTRGIFGAEGCNVQAIIRERNLSGLPAECNPSK
jgi:hypothetical protein